jgi:N-acyl-L-homoserine lactone synthetase
MMGPKIISIENFHEFGDVMPGMLRLRFREFKQRQSYDIPTFKNMEYDKYDTPAAVYVVWRNRSGEVLGCSRMAPTDRAYMIEDLWPSLVTDMPLPHDPFIWESSRFCIDSNLSVEERKQIKNEILQAKIEYALAVGIKGMIGVMPPLIWRSVFINSGWPVDHLGEVLRLETGEKIVAGWIHVLPEILTRLRDRTGIKRTLINEEHSAKVLQRAA